MNRGAPLAGLALLLVLMLQLPSLRAVFKFAPSPELAGPAMLVLALGAYWLVLRAVSGGWPIVRPFGWPAVVLLVLAGVGAATYLIYPLADARAGGGSTSDDAMIAPVQALLSGRGLYDLDGLIDVRASPGPAWVLANAPFTFMGHSAFPYALMTPVWMALGWAALRASGHPAQLAGLWLVMPFTALIGWELAVTGYDILALSCAITILYVMTERSAGAWVWVLLVAVLTGLFATSRIVFPILAPLLGLVVWKRDRLQGAAFVLVALATAAAAHAAFYFSSEIYHPFHLIDRARTNVGPVFMAAGAAVSVLVCLAAFVRMKPEPLSSLGWFTACLVTPLAFVAAGELAGMGFNLALWEGGNYLLPAAGVAALYALRAAGAATPARAETPAAAPQGLSMRSSPRAARG